MFLSSLIVDKLTMWASKSKKSFEWKCQWVSTLNSLNCSYFTFFSSSVRIIQEKSRWKLKKSKNFVPLRCKFYFRCEHQSLRFIYLEVSQYHLRMLINLVITAFYPPNNVLSYYVPYPMTVSRSLRLFNTGQLQFSHYYYRSCEAWIFESI